MSRNSKILILILIFIKLQEASAQKCSVFYNASRDWGSDYKYSFNSHVTNPKSTLYLWNFGDGTTSNSQNPVHQFPTHKDFNVCLIAKDTVSQCVDTFCNTITFCEVKFSTRGLGLIFDEYPVQDRYSSKVKWDWGDGEISNKLKGDHIYKSPGIYTVCLTNYCTDIDSSIHCEKLDRRCSAHFSYSFDSSYSLKTNFSVDVKTDSSYKFFWQLGESKSQISERSSQFSYTYKKDGYYTVILQTIDTASNCIDSFGINIRVGRPLCDTSFYLFRTNSCNMISYVSYVFTENLKWDFGDGSYAYDKFGHHTYDSLKTYKACMTHTCYTTDTVKKCLIIPVKTRAYFTKYIDALDKHRVVFTNKSLHTKKFRTYWYFGDQTSEDIEHPKHVYKNAGRYNILLSIIDDSLQCTSEYMDSVTIDSIPKQMKIVQYHSIKFSVFPNPTNSTFTIEFTNPEINMTSLEIIDSWGRLCLTQDLRLTENPKSINIESLQAGLYLIRLTDANQRVYSKIIKN